MTDFAFVWQFVGYIGIGLLLAVAFTEAGIALWESWGRGR